MAVKVLELHHHGVRVGSTPSDADRALAFYRDVLGLTPDAGRPYIADIPGYWMEVGANAQIHLISAEGVWRLADGPGFGLGITKELLNAELSADLHGALDNEARAQSLCMRTQDFKEAYEAFTQKRPPRFTGR